MLDRNLRNRYSRQTVLPVIGEEGQARLLASRMVVLGCGALGGNIAMLLTRAGVGHLRIVDRDFIEVHNLQRQVLYDEEDIRLGLPKAIAAERRLRKINSTVRIEGVVTDINFTNIETLCQGADVILDGQDNVETRYLINDAALKMKIPWVYGGAIATTGMTMTIIPGRTPCFRCLAPVAPPPRATATCETAGIIGTVPALVAAVQATEAIKLVVAPEEVSRDLLFIDIWGGVYDHVKVERRPDCPACHGRYEYLDKRFTEKITSLCGQSRAVQVLDMEVKSVSLDRLAERLKDSVANLVKNEYVLSFQAGENEITVFPDGRAIIKNTLNQETAREIFQKYVKSNLAPGA